VPAYKTKQNIILYNFIDLIKSWSVASKAKYLYSLLPTLKSEGIKSQSIELAKKIGSKSHQLYN
jgi:hypothetical protein